MLVTGGGAGLGAAISQAVSSAGGAVAVIDSRAESAQNIARSITANGGIALAVEADVTDPVAMEEAVAAVMERFGRLTGLVNNAGTTRRGTVVDGAADDWDLVMATNYSGTLNASRAAHAALRDVGGSVVNVTSVSSRHPNPGRTGYSPSKAAVVALTGQLALEWGPDGIRINAVAPGVMSGTLLSAHESSALRGRRAAALPLRRTGVPADVANAVVFLLSDLASYVTGQELAVDGGWGISLVSYLPGIDP